MKKNRIYTLKGQGSYINPNNMFTTRKTERRKEGIKEGRKEAREGRKKEKK